MPILSRLFLVINLLFCFSAFAATNFKIITLKHHLAEEILPMIQPLAGEDGVITGMQNQIIVRASPEHMAEIEQTIASLDVALQNLKITVSHQNNHASSRNGVQVSGSQRIGDIEVRTNRYPKNAPDGAQIDIENNQSNIQNYGTQFINVLDGRAAFIRVGQSVPFTQEWVTYMHRYTNVQQTTQYVDITTGFSVRPHIMGDQIELEISPRIAKPNQQGMIDFEELGTIVRINKGEWFDLGGTMQQKDVVSRAILSQQNSNQTQSNALFIRVD
ncbi:MAG: secretin N-terminal domain-containing protein [Methylophilaceae bacterium]